MHMASTGTPGNWNFGFVSVKLVGKIDNLDRQAFALSTGFADERFKAGFCS